MKKIIFGALSLFMITTSCNVLDIDPTKTYGESVPYSSIRNLDLYVKGFYSLLYANADINFGGNCVMDDGAADLIKYSWYGIAEGSINKYRYEANYISPDANLFDKWNGLYDHIRRLNEYLYDVNKGKADALDQTEVIKRTAEVRFLRAFAYQELIIRYGGVIMRLENLDDHNNKTKGRSSKEDCWDFVINEYQEIANSLPKSWDGANMGRITSGAAYAMKARACLYAERWQEALTATEQVDKIGTFGLLDGMTQEDYIKIFETPHNKELILTSYFKQGVKQHQYDLNFCPPYDYKAAGVGNVVGAAAAPTDEYASAFDIKIGTEWHQFNWDNIERYADGPWVNRDPRFYSSILYNGAPWKGRNLELFVDGNDGFMEFTGSSSNDGVRHSTTGYIVRKFLKNDPSINFGLVMGDQYWTEMRYAEVLLIRSEAQARLNNYSEAYNNLWRIQDRVGITRASNKGNWDDYLVDLQKERICELGLEGHRYFDLIRWGKAESVLSRQRLHGVKITKSGNDFAYERIVCDTKDRYYPKKYTIYPIPTAEIKNNILCEQNSLWK